MDHQHLAIQGLQQAHFPHIPGILPDDHSWDFRRAETQVAGELKRLERDLPDIVEGALGDTRRENVLRVTATIQAGRRILEFLRANTGKV